MLFLAHMNNFSFFCQAFSGCCVEVLMFCTWNYYYKKICQIFEICIMLMSVLFYGRKYVCVQRKGLLQCPTFSILLSEVNTTELVEPVG